MGLKGEKVSNTDEYTSFLSTCPAFLYVFYICNFFKNSYLFEGHKQSHTEKKALIYFTPQMPTTSQGWARLNPGLPRGCQSPNCSPPGSALAGSRSQEPSQSLQHGKQPS